MLRVLGGERFVNTYWQQQPLFVDRVWPHPPNFLAADELAGLATDPDVTSRIVMGDTAAEDWMIIEGPVTETFFSDTPETDWQLSVYAVDRHVPVYGQVREAFRFLPDWRFDGLAVTYCVPGGTGGRSRDDADLFFLQVAGETDWSIADPACPADNPNVAPAWRGRTCPGDLLYLPPDSDYYGVAASESVTYCIRFRVPTTAELLRGWAQHRAQQLSDHANEALGWERPPANPAALPQQTRAELRAALRSCLDPSDSELDEWLAAYLTRSEDAFDQQLPESAMTPAAVRQALSNGRELVVHPAARLAWLNTPDNGPLLYVNGYPEAVPSGAAQDVAEELTRLRRFTGADLPRAESTGTASVVDLLADGLQKGWLAFDDELIE
jgi:50S ribosomal protein L16 3-hydroxylase